ncbi:heme-binding protein [Ferruginibacter sp. HRS2-29]|uniref:GlcG/HbpS family heme-binding protein n=1 Tax=Ferruginibacter sp. HRS2-29 TaxID=2487334 RepID=UPI0020CF39C4|nr:heme-binding protein [Ferruginibacter sp. HRS2-29]
MGITLEQAEKISTAAKSKAREIGVPMNIAVVDQGANLVAFHRMDNAWLGSG